jgi:predicted transcriptional regulator
MVSMQNKYSRVHTIGVGNGISVELIKGCAEKGKGYYVFVGGGKDSSEEIIQLLSDSMSPVISQMRLSYDKNLVESIIPNPESLPYVLKNDVVNFYVTFKGQL